MLIVVHFQLKMVIEILPDYLIIILIDDFQNLKLLLQNVGLGKIILDKIVKSLSLFLGWSHINDPEVSRN